jgi:hypothetical protein
MYKSNKFSFYLALTCVPVVTFVAGWYFGRAGEVPDPSGPNTTQVSRSSHDFSKSQRGNMPQGVSFDNESDRQQNSSKIRGMSVSSVSPIGRLTSGAIEHYEMTAAEAQNVDVLIANSFKEFLDSVKDRVIFDEARSDIDKGIEIFQIRAAQDRGVAMLEKFREGLVGTLGQERGDSFFDSFEYRNTLNGFGSLDTLLKFEITDPESPLSDHEVTLEERNPDTGEVVLSFGANAQAFGQRFGEIFTSINPEN